MRKQLSTIITTLIFMSCGGNAENNVPNEIEEDVVLKIGEPITVKDNLIETHEEVPIEDKEENETEVDGIGNYDETHGEFVRVSDDFKTNDEIVEETPVVQEPVYNEEFKPDHKPWDEVTKKHVSSTGKVNYKGMKADLSKINTYLKHLDNTTPKKDWSKNEKLAYWLNLYNAATVYLVTSNYPTKSITKLSGGKPWDKKFVKSGDKTYSLNDIENKIIRPRFKDPRIHAALNCAAVSCPKLLNGAYMPSKLNAQLDQQTRAWINDSAKNKLNGSKAQVSQIFDWYKVDFKGGVVAFINKYISTGVALQANAKITYLEYDWALNE